VYHKLLSIFLIYSTTLYAGTLLPSCRYSAQYLTAFICASVVTGPLYADCYPTVLCLLRWPGMVSWLCCIWHQSMVCWPCSISHCLTEV